MRVRTHRRDTPANTHDNHKILGGTRILNLYTYQTREMQKRVVFSDWTQFARIAKKVFVFKTRPVLEPNVLPHKQIVNDYNVKECISIEEMEN